MINIILIIFPLIMCILHLQKYGIEDKYDIDFLIVLIELIILLLYNIFIIIWVSEYLHKKWIFLWKCQSKHFVGL